MPEETREIAHRTEDEDADRALVEHERAEIRGFVKQLSSDDIKSGRWEE